MHRPMRKPTRRRGSVLLLVVGLLTILAMLGSTLLIVARVERKTSDAIATSAPLSGVAESVLTRLRADRLADLYIDPGSWDYDDPGHEQDYWTDDLVYGEANSWHERIDYPADNVDRALAAFEPYQDANDGNRWKWRHLSDLTGDVEADNVALMIDIDGEMLANPDLIDTDGFWAVDSESIWIKDDTGAPCFGDALLFPSGIKDRDGEEYLVAVRMIDASGLVNANIAYTPIPVEGGKWFMPISDIAVNMLPDGPNPFDLDQARNNVGNAWEYSLYYSREAHVRPRPGPDELDYTPFDVTDLLALGWGGRSLEPPTAVGRLTEILGGKGKWSFNNPRRYLTTHSASRIFIPKPVREDPTELEINETEYDQIYKVDLIFDPAYETREEAFKRLYRGFYNLFDQSGIAIDPERLKKVAAQLAVNAIDFQDEDSEITRIEPKALPGGVSIDTDPVYGVERQPFITEATYTIERNPITLLLDKTYYAIELYNPYVKPIDLEDFYLQMGTDNPVKLSGSIGNNDLLVIVNDSAVEYDGDHLLLSQLDLARPVRLLREVGTDEYAVLDRVTPKAFLISGDPNTDPNKYIASGDTGARTGRIRRADEPADAAYMYGFEDEFGVATVLYERKSDPPDSVPALDDSGNDLGKANEISAADFSPEPTPSPIYVRNDRFINVAEVNRLLSVGPGDLSTAGNYSALTERLAAYPTSVRPYNVAYLGFYPLGSGERGPRAGCLASEYFTIASPMNDGLDNDGDFDAPDYRDETETNYHFTGDPDALEKRPLSGGEDILHGLININTAPMAVLECLPSLSGLTELDDIKDADRRALAAEIIAYRDKLANPDGNDYSGSRTAPSLPIYIRSNLPTGIAFRSAGEIVLPLAIWVENQGPGSIEPYDNNGPAKNYSIADSDSDDGLPANTLAGDLTKRYVLYSRMSNCITVRSDVYIAYIAVFAPRVELYGLALGGGGANQLLHSGVSGYSGFGQTDAWADNQWKDKWAVITGGVAAGQIRRIASNTDGDDGVLTLYNPWVDLPDAGDAFKIVSLGQPRRYMAVIDRTNCRAVDDQPRVLMFAEITQ